MSSTFYIHKEGRVFCTSKSLDVYTMVLPNCQFTESCIQTLQLPNKFRTSLCLHLLSFEVMPLIKFIFGFQSQQLNDYKKNRSFVAKMLTTKNPDPFISWSLISAKKRYQRRWIGGSSALLYIRSLHAILSSHGLTLASVAFASIHNCPDPSKWDQKLIGEE